MNITYTDGRNWLPNGIIAQPPPIYPDDPTQFQLGFSLARLVAEYWTAKTIRAYGSWTIESGVTPWAFDQTFPANATGGSTSRTPAERVVAGRDSLITTGGLPAFNGTLSISIDWTEVYKVGDLYYPNHRVEIGAGRFTSSYNEGTGSPSGVAITAFGQTLACNDYNGGGCVGSCTIETTEYWT